MELGYQYLEYDNIDLTTVNFAYRYNSKTGKFEVVNDGSKYTISEMSWALVEDNANLYEFHLVDVIEVEVVTDPVTKEVQFNEKPIPEDR